MEISPSRQKEAARRKSSTDRSLLNDIPEKLLLMMRTVPGRAGCLLRQSCVNQNDIVSCIDHMIR